MSIARAALIAATLALAPAAATAQSGPGEPLPIQPPPGQSLQGQPAPQSGPDSRPAGTILNRDAPITEQEVRRSESFRSRGVGQRKEWNLDIGSFKEELQARPEDLPNEPIGGYSGFRFRMPLKGRDRQ